LTEERTRTVGETVTAEISAGLGVEVDGIGASAEASTSVSQTWSRTFRSEFTTKRTTESTREVSSADAQRAWAAGQSFWWTWQFTTTYNWNDIQVVTDTEKTAYTRGIGFPPKCYPDYGIDDSHQSCYQGGWLPGAREALGGNATVGGNSTVGGTATVGGSATVV
jgi:hypothetical protein